LAYARTLVLVNASDMVHTPTVDQRGELRIVMLSLAMSADLVELEAAAKGMQGV
jgi:hypothetical protein